MLVPMEYGIRPTRDGPGAVHVCTRCLSSTNAAQINVKPFAAPARNPPARAVGAPGPDCSARERLGRARQHDQVASPASTRRTARGRFARFVERRLRDDRDRAATRSAAALRRRSPRARRRRRSTPRRRFRSAHCRLVTKSARASRVRECRRRRTPTSALTLPMSAQSVASAPSASTRLLKRPARSSGVGEPAIEIELQVTLGHRQRRSDLVGQRIQDLRQVRLHPRKPSTSRLRSSVWHVHREMTARQMERVGR